MKSNKMAKEKKHFIKSFEIKKFRGIVDSGKIEIPADTQWIFLTGENGFGKTSVLQALAAGLYGKENVNALNVEERENAEITLFLQDNREFRGFQKRIFKDLLAYGANRLYNGTTTSNLPTDSLFNIETKFFNVDDILIQFILQSRTENKDEKKEYTNAFNMLEGVFKKIIPDLEKITLSEGTVKEILYQEKFATKPLTYNYLSTGFRSWITIIGDILKRHYKINQIRFNTSKIRLIVFIDEFDLHLHPKWQRKLPSLLSDIFENVQFVVSTHSPIPLLGAPEKSAFLKVTRNAEEGVIVHKLDINPTEFTPNAFLTSEVFDMDGVFSVAYDENPEKQKGFYTYLNFKEDSKAAEELNQKANEAIEKAKLILGDKFYKS